MTEREELRKYQEDFQRMQANIHEHEKGISNKQINMVTQAFLYYFLDSEVRTIEECLHCTKLWAEKMCPEILRCYGVIEAELIKRFALNALNGHLIQTTENQ